MTRLILPRRSVLRGLGLTAGALALPAVIRPREARAAAGSLNIISYPNFIPKDFRENFERESGITLNIKETDQASVVFSTLTAEAANPTTDLVVSVGHLFKRYIDPGLIAPVDVTRLNNWDRVLPLYRDASWLEIGGAKWGLPILLGFQTLPYNSERVKDDIDSWGAIFDEKYKGKITWRLNDFLLFALTYLGRDPDLVDYVGDDATARKYVQEAKDFVIAHKPLIRKFYDSNAELQQLFINEDVHVAHARNGSIGELIKNGFPLKFSIPKEGSYSFVYNWSLTKGAKNEDNAYRFLNAYLSADGLGGQLIRNSGYLSTFEGAAAGVENVAAVLTPEQLQRIRFYRIGNDKLKSELFSAAEAEIKAA